MTKGELDIFERAWALIWEFLYKIIAFFSGKTIGPDADGTTATLPDMDGIKPVY